MCWEVFCERWPTEGARERLEQLRSGAEVATGSGEVFSALSSIGDPTVMRYSAMGDMGNARFVLGADDVLREVR